VDVTAGTASAHFSVFGMAGVVSVDAFDCDLSGNCNAQSKASVSVNIELAPPIITSPSDGAFVKDWADVEVEAPGGTIAFYARAAPPVFDSSPPFEVTLPLGLYFDTGIRLTVVQCNSSGTLCNGASDFVDVIKDTQGPGFLQVASSKPFFPVLDGYKDVFGMGATQRQKSVRTWVEVRRQNRVIRRIALGPTRRGELDASWNGRDQGELVPEGQYEFQFFGVDEHGNEGRSSVEEFRLSHKRLVRKEVARTVSAKSSLVGDGSGECSDVHSLPHRGSRHSWRGGIGYYSQSKCQRYGGPDVALGFHRYDVPNAIRYHSLQVAAFGGGAKKNRESGYLILYRKRGTAGADREVDGQVQWHVGPTVQAPRYLFRGRARWGFATTLGNWFDVKEYRLRLEISVLR
jgi:hypothetical protein